MKKILGVLFLVLLLSPGIYAQPVGNIDENLAAEFYRNGEYDKSAALYKKLLDGNPDNNYYYEHYLSSLLFLKDYETASKELKRLIKRKDNLIYKIDLGHIYHLQGDVKNATAVYDDIIKNLPAEPETIGNTASAFMRRDRGDYAILTYERGRVLLNDKTAFTLELATLYGEKGLYEKMFEEYLALMNDDPYMFEGVRDRLQDFVVNDAAYDIFRKMLLKKIQLNPADPSYAYMLAWLFIQRKDFHAAFVQIKALDKRLNEGGRGLVELANTVAGNGDYELADLVYTSVIDLGENAPYYVHARRGQLDLRYIKITQSPTYAAADVEQLIADYNAFINTYGMMHAETGPIILRLAEIQA
ncbi:MAG: hypothetical protein M3Q97_07115, partial [Bacteroidota bacterium]|nr:hypothetical protein [Bacteroidota bacterium]